MSQNASPAFLPDDPHAATSPGDCSAKDKDNQLSMVGEVEAMEKESKEEDPARKSFPAAAVSKPRDALNSNSNRNAKGQESHVKQVESPESAGYTLDSPIETSSDAMKLPDEDRNVHQDVPETLETVDRAATTSPLSSSPPRKLDRITLERNQTEVSALEEDHNPNDSPPSDTGDRKNDEQARDADSSDDESSYFAQHLPSPKSSRRYSFSSNASAPGRSEHNDANRQTDASLSFSDESEDHGRVHHSDSGPFPPGAVKSPSTDFQAYPHQITRMHSVSSLVSTSSHNSSGTEQSVGDGDEMRVAATDPHGTAYNSKNNGVPSGRHSPIMGEHPPSRPQTFFSSSPSSNPDPSPPTIMPGYPNPAGLPHPQPHLMAHEQWAAWAAASNAAAMHQQMYSYGYGATDGDDPPRSSSLQSSSTAWSGATLAYSEDGGAIRASSGQPRAGTRSLSREEAPVGKDGTASDSRDKKRGSVDEPVEQPDNGEDKAFEVYWRRWLMLFYMSLLNLLSDWTCYSVAPIALMTEEAFGNINPEQLVVVFLCANGFATACEPIILSRLGLRRTVLFGSLLLMIGSIIKSGGMPPIIAAKIEKGEGEWRVYLGFLLVGLSQPLYQCTPALLSASWFPESERTLATGVALNSNQLGIGFAFIFGTLLVATSDDIPSYFGLLSIISTITFFGILMQFDDAPPTPPSDTARVMRGTIEGLPNLRQVFDSIRGSPGGGLGSDIKAARSSATSSGRGANRKSAHVDKKTREAGSSKRSGGTTSSRKKSGRSSSRKNQHERGSPSFTSVKDIATGALARRTSPRAQPKTSSVGGTLKGGFHGLAPAPSPARWGRVSSEEPAAHSDWHSFPAPSPMMPGGASSASSSERQYSEEEQPLPQQGVSYVYPHPMPYDAQGQYLPQAAAYMPEMQYPMDAVDDPSGQPMPQGLHYGPSVGAPYSYPYQSPQGPYQGYPRYQPYQYWDPQSQPLSQYPHQHRREFYQPPIDPYYYQYQPEPFQPQRYQTPTHVLPSSEAIDDGAEPVLTMTAHRLDIAIRDDQILLSIRACLARPGFVHALVAFTVSGIVINTLSTYMDYLVRLNGAGRQYTGIVGGSFQFAIMTSSLIIGQVTDKTRAYYSITVCMLVLGAFGLAECGVDLDENRGTDLRWALVIVAILVGPLQPVSTELGVDVVYPLSENTVLVIQQLFSNLLSALFIPCFKAMKDIGRESIGGTTEERPAYTFSFYLLIVVHAAATVFFATFNGRYLRYEHELEKKAIGEQKKAISEHNRAGVGAAFQPVHGHGHAYYPGYPDQHPEPYRAENVPLLHPIV